MHIVDANSEHLLLLLKHESIFFYRRIFKRLPSDEIVSNYIRAHFEIPEFQEFDPAELNSISLILDRRLNFLGIEPWLRKKSRLKNHALTSKLLLLMYISECSQNGFSINRLAGVGNLRYFISLISFAIRSFFCMLGGLFQKRIHGIV
jgi:hypothetical protein